MQRAAPQKAAAVGQEDTGTDCIKQRANKQILQVADTSEQGQKIQTPPAHRTAFTSGNAFAHMMQKQRERAQTWTFYLGRADDGGLFWHFWRDVKGSRPLPDIITHCSGNPVSIQGTDQATMQGCKQQVAWTAESQSSLADLECHVDDSADRAAAGKVTLKLCTNIEPRHGGRLDMGSLLWAPGTAGRPWEYTGPASLLKSALQKNVRRGRAEEAVRCAQRLLQSEPGELLRRAIVISVEDAVLHPQLPLLVFLMAAVAKGYILGRTLASACLRIMHDLAVVPVQDSSRAGEVGSSSCPGGQRAEPGALSEAGACLVRSMLIRAAYGGLQGDVRMLRRSSCLWLARLSGLANPPSSMSSHGSSVSSSQQWWHFLQSTCAGGKPTDVGVAWGSNGRLKPEDVPPAAVDFHISSILEGLLSDANILAAARVAAAKAGSEPAAALKSAMWHFSGSCNHRSLLQERSREDQEGHRQRLQHLQPLWEAAGHAAEAWAHLYIQARFRPA
ncbi:hypothetical protein CVIRNUC_005529 [Coccomyxa viridis]|uniref:Uncharacterized protein n=1 Tax=Coccomyxa viridis TaxID=1274662 RepID=A0AAV1I745_9CHLO|nr:hypothetical protein CVIRNUC_005529 [Coccomyxa viridis]